MPMFRSQFEKLFFDRLPYLKRVTYEEYGEPDDMFSQVMSVVGSSKMREQYTGVTGFGLASAIPEGEPMIYGTLLEDYPKTLTHTKYGLGFQVTEEASEDDLDGPMNQGGRALGRAMRTTKAIEVWKIFNLAFRTGAGQTGETGPDSVAPFHNAHTLKEGGTFSNEVLSDLSIASLETALNIFDDFRDQRNQLIDVGAGILLHPPEMQWLVGEILRSPDKPDTANRSINVLEGKLRPIMSKWLTDADSCFIGPATIRGEMGPVLLNRRPMRIENDMDFDTGTAKTKATTRHAQGWTNYIGWVGLEGQ